MMEGTEIGVGSDWCTLRLTKFCLGNTPSEVVLLGDEIKACRACLRELIKDEFGDEFDWARGIHEGLCETVNTQIEHEEITFCPKCLMVLLLDHDQGAFDGVFVFHNKHHSEPRPLSGQGPGFPKRACRECLLIALFQVDPNFFRLLTKQGDALLISILPGALALRTLEKG